MVGGDPPNGYLEEGVWMKDIAYDDDVVEDAPNIADDVLPDVVGDVHERDHVIEEDTPLDANHNVQRQVRKALDQGDAQQTCRRATTC